MTCSGFYFSALLESLNLNHIFDQNSFFSNAFCFLSFWSNLVWNLSFSSSSSVGELVDSGLFLGGSLTIPRSSIGNASSMWFTDTGGGVKTRRHLVETTFHQSKVVATKNCTLIAKKFNFQQGECFAHLLILFFLLHSTLTSKFIN